jgi:hypothetical protein
MSLPSTSAILEALQQTIQGMSEPSRAGTFRKSVQWIATSRERISNESIRAGRGGFGPSLPDAATHSRIGSRLCRRALGAGNQVERSAIMAVEQERLRG